MDSDFFTFILFRCNSDHYWAFIFTGEADTITFTQNYVYHTSGRGPHIGGTSGYTQYIRAFSSPSPAYFG